MSILNIEAKRHDFSGEAHLSDKCCPLKKNITIQGYSVTVMLRKCVCGEHNDRSGFDAKNNYSFLPMDGVYLSNDGNITKTKQKQMEIYKGQYRMVYRFYFVTYAQHPSTFLR